MEKPVLYYYRREQSNTKNGAQKFGCNDEVKHLMPSKRSRSEQSSRCCKDAEGYGYDTSGTDALLYIEAPIANAPDDAFRMELKGVILKRAFFRSARKSSVTAKSRSEST